ncbi:MAG: prepilin peptidase [Deltaproteobacteria bacterium]|nr:prepilin peptidase [Deltaproteobacteria bacterium]
MGMEEAQWGLLPTLFSLPWLVLAPAGRPRVLAVFFVLAALMASYDLAVRRIPNILTGITALAGLAWGLVHGGLPGLGQAALGGLAGFGLLAIFYFLGMVGAGDVKALGALGTFLGPWGALVLFCFTTMAGGVLALAAILLFRRGAVFWGGGLWSLRVRGEGMNLPYGLAIACGALLVLLQGGSA